MRPSRPNRTTAGFGRPPKRSDLPQWVRFGTCRPVVHHSVPGLHDLKDTTIRRPSEWASNLLAFWPPLLATRSEPIFWAKRTSPAGPEANRPAVGLRDAHARARTRVSLLRASVHAHSTCRNDQEGGRKQEGGQLTMTMIACMKLMLCSLR